MVKAATRDKHLLDLVLTDMPQVVKTKVLTKISDHNTMEISIALNIQAPRVSKRTCWVWKEAQWAKLQSKFKKTDWNIMFDGTTVDCATCNLVDHILCVAKQFIPLREYSFTASAHPWLNQNCIDLVAPKHAAENMPNYKQMQEQCTQGLLEEYKKHITRTKSKIADLPKSSKQWWKL